MNRGMLWFDNDPKTNLAVKIKQAGYVVEKLSCGYINKTGKAVIKPQYDRARCFSEGLAAVMIGDPRHPKWGYINKQGRFVIRPTFDDASDFSDGEAEVIIAGQKHTIDREGAYND